MKHLYIATVSDYLNSGITDIQYFNKPDIDKLINLGFVTLTDNHVSITDAGNNYYESLTWEDFPDTYGE